jgi:hypothetical protein
VSRDDFRGRFLAIGRTVREWALREPATYALLFGSPVPGYQAPAERTTGPGTRVIGALVRLWEDAHVAGSVVAPGPVPRISRALAADAKRIRKELGMTAPDDLVLRGVLGWAALFGCVSFEVFGQYGADTFAAVGDLFEHQLQLLADTTGLPAA